MVSKSRSLYGNAATIKCQRCSQGAFGNTVAGWRYSSWLWLLHSLPRSGLWLTLLLKPFHPVPPASLGCSYCSYWFAIDMLFLQMLVLWWWCLATLSSNDFCKTLKLWHFLDNCHLLAWCGWVLFLPLLECSLAITLITKCCWKWPTSAISKRCILVVVGPNWNSNCTEYDVKDGCSAAAGPPCQQRMSWSLLILLNKSNNCCCQNIYYITQLAAGYDGKKSSLPVDATSFCKAMSIDMASKQSITA